MPPFHLELDPAELKLTHTALRSLMADVSHDDHELRAVLRGVLAKMPPPEEIAAIDLSGLDRRRHTAAA